MIDFVSGYLEKAAGHKLHVPIYWKYNGVLFCTSSGWQGPEQKSSHTLNFLCAFKKTKVPL